MSADLAALGIDSAEARWLAARDYLDEQRRKTEKALNALWLICEFLDLAEQNAIRRNAISVDGWGLKIDLHAVDYLTARATILARYKGPARDRALEILDPFVPPALRKEPANVRR